MAPPASAAAVSWPSGVEGDALPEVQPVHLLQPSRHSGGSGHSGGPPKVRSDAQRGEVGEPVEPVRAPGGVGDGEGVGVLRLRAGQRGE